VAKAQVTTSSISGVVIDDLGLPLTGATVIAIHSPSETKYGTTCQNNGHYNLANLRVGGPYQLTVSFVGFESIIIENIYLDLDVDFSQNFTLYPTNFELDDVVVSHKRNDIFEDDQTGVATNFGKNELQNTPSLNRSLQDITRLSPQGFQNSFGGNNYRFNNLSIDGASNNDVVGFQEPASGASGSVASGTPGALAGTQPISLDAIEQVQVSLAPFDVRKGNFTGANINAVTKAGTNAVNGSAYFYGKNQWLTGNSIDANRTPIADFYDFQTGFSIGGPVKKGKLFYFANYELAKRNEPVLNQPGDEGTNISYELAQQIADTLISRYDYNPGSYGAVNNQRNSQKFFLRFDYNINQHHQLTIRDNLVIASADNLERGANFLNYANQGFRHKSLNNSLVTELKSTFPKNISNHLMVSFNTINDTREFEGRVFPHIQIQHNTANTIFAGSYREASIYGVKVKTTQINDHLNIYRGKHTLTVGTNNEFYNIEYRFLTAWNGRWEYNSVEDFFNNQPKRVRGVYNYNNNDYQFNLTTPSADFRVMLLSAFAQDKFKVNKRLTLTAGLRLDLQIQADKVPVNEAVVNTPEFAHFDNKFGGIPNFNPRFGFKYAFNDDKNIQMRGGSGLFTGRIPFAWYAYAHYVSGLNYGNIDLRPETPLELTENLADLTNLQSGLTEINLVDNDFKLPRTWRSSLAFDFKLPKNIVFTVEGMYSKMLQAIQFKSINIKDSTANYVGADARPYYLGNGDEKKINPNFTNVFLLTNTKKGYKYSVTAQLKQRIKNKANWMIAYTYGESKDISNGVRNSMAANFNWNQAIESNNPDLAYSNFDLRHRIVAAADYQFNIGKKKRNNTIVNLVFTARSGSPYSFTYASDVNNDSSSQNDLVYVPANENEINLIDITDSNGAITVSAAQQWLQLDNYINSIDYLSQRRGQYVERNGARTPWNTQLDIRLTHQIKLKKKKNGDWHRLDLTLDISNFLNLLNRNWGHQTFVPNVQNSSYQLLEFEGVENGEPTYQFKNPSGKPWQVDQLASRWQAQLGLRYSF